MQVSTLVFTIYTSTTLMREQLLVTMFGFKSHCKHVPTCSQFTHEAIQEKGVVVGLALGLRRLARCW